MPVRQTDSVPLPLLSRNSVLTVPRPVFCGLFFPRHLRSICVCGDAQVADAKPVLCDSARSCTWYRTAQVVPQVREYMTAGEGWGDVCVRQLYVSWVGRWGDSHVGRQQLM
jgi:hypothetical protein